MHFNQILKHTIALKLFNTVLMFLINLLMVRLLGVDDSGIFFYDIAILSFLILIISGSLESGITFYSSKNHLSINAIIAFILPLLAVQVIISRFILSQVNFSINNNLALLFVFSNLTLVYFSAFFYAKKRFVFLNIISCSVNVITTLLLFYWWVSKEGGGANTNHFILTYILSLFIQALLLVLIILYGREQNGVSPAKVTTVVKRIFRYSSVAFVSNIVFFLVTRIDYFFVEKYCSNIALSNYVQVSKFGQLLMLVPSIIASVVFPYSADSSGTMLLSKIQQLCRAITFVFIPLTILLILTANWIFPLVFGKGFNLMYIALLLYLPGFFALSIITVLAAHLAGKKLLKINLVASVLALIIVVIGDLMFIPAGGIRAAALVSSIAYIICTAYILWFYKAKFHCNISDFFALKRAEIKTIFIQFKIHIPSLKNNQP